MKLSTIIAEIHNMESKDLDKVVEAVKYARSQAHRQMANTLRSGAYGHFTCNDWELGVDALGRWASKRN